MKTEKPKTCTSRFWTFGPSGETRTRGILLPKQARYQLRYTWIYANMKKVPKAGALPVAVPEKIIGLALTSIFSTAATRSAPFIRHWRRSPRSPTALHLDKYLLIIHDLSRKSNRNFRCVDI